MTLVTRLAASKEMGRVFREEAMQALSELPGYDWVGVYALDGDRLILDAYVGAATDHTQIQVGVGVCGTAVAENANQIVRDVRQRENYLACSLATRSEIVVLIRREGRILGQIDVDGHQVGRFDAQDEALLEQVAGLIAERWESRPGDEPRRMRESNRSEL